MHAIRKILVPVDFSPCAEAAADYAVALAEAFAARIELLHVWQPPYELGPMMPSLGVDGEVGGMAESLRNHADLALAAMARKVEALHRHAVAVRLEPGSPKATIVRVAADEGFDLVVMGTHGRTGLSRALLGSVAEGVVRRSTVPVLTVRSAPRPSAPAGEEEDG